MGARGTTQRGWRRRVRSARRPARDALRLGPRPARRRRRESV